MSVKPDGARPLDSEAAAHRRWLITVAITVMFGGFGAVMAYLSYARHTKPAMSSPGRSRPASTRPTVAPPAAAEPSSDPAPSDEEAKPKADKDEDKDKEK
jgi:hypothetical protein